MRFRYPLPCAFRSVPVKDYFAILERYLSGYLFQGFRPAAMAEHANASRADPPLRLNRAMVLGEVPSRRDASESVKLSSACHDANALAGMSAAVGAMIERGRPTLRFCGCFPMVPGIIISKIERQWFAVINSCQPCKPEPY
jgi:hypothetical protein